MKLLNAGAAIVELWIPRAYYAALVRPNAKLSYPERAHKLWEWCGWKPGGRRKSAGRY